MAGTIAPKRQALGRADLLRALEQAPQAGLRMAMALGYTQRPSQTAQPKRTSRQPQPPLNLQQEQAPALRTQDHRVEMFGAALLSGHDDATPAPPPAADAAAAPPAGGPLTAADWLPAPNAPLPEAPAPIVPRQRVLPALARATSQQVPAGVDLARLAALVARRELPARLPLQRQQRPAARLSLVLDTAGGLALYSADMHRLARWLERHPDIRPHRVAVPANAQNPMAGWLDWRVANQPCPPHAAAAPRTLPWWQPVAGEQVVLVSDLGLAAWPQAQQHTGPAQPDLSPWPAWRRWLAHMRSSGAQGQVWSPIPLRVSTAAAQGPRAAGVRPLRVVHWSAAAPLRATTLAAGGQHHTPARLLQAQALVARLACAPWIDASLLRQMRLTLPRAVDAGIEHLAWTQCGLTPGLVARRLLPQAQPQRRQDFQHLPVAVQRQVLALANAHYARLSPPLAHMHTLAWQSRAAPAAHATAAQELTNAQAFVRRMADHADQAQGVPEHELSLCLSGWLQAADTTERQHHEHLYAALWQAWRQLHPRVQPLPMPSGVSHALLVPPAAQAAPPRWLVFDAESGQVVFTPQPPQAGQGLLMPQALRLNSLDVGPLGGQHQLPVALQPTAIHMLGRPGPGLLLRSRAGQWQVGPVQRPQGVLRWWQGPQGLAVQGAPVGALALQAQAPAPHLVPSPTGLRLVLPAQPAGHPGLQFGIDAEHGLWLDWTVGAATQRFRWAPPGEFWMGSPETEPGRYDNEGPHHRVRISQGFWVADTPCTQGFWQAVTGSNPSHFKGDSALPVEQLSWQDVQAALGPFNQHLPPGATAALPTEAQWEYAARGGTHTAFYLGEQLRDDQANLGGAGTCPVKQYAPNAWGLYDCHGQVLEWCDDGMRDYAQTSHAGEVVVDPRGEAGPGGRRAVRGGTWFFDARHSRSATRSAGGPGSGLRHLGFRLVLCVSLRSTSPGRAPGGPIWPRDGASSSSSPGGMPGRKK